MAKARPDSAELVIAGVTVKPGTRLNIDIAFAALYTHTAVSMPVQVIRGRSAGPTLFVCAAVHGDEINGVEIVRRLIRSITPERIKGTLICIPIVNVLGLLNHSRYLPDGRDLNRSFPGSPNGSLTARLANLFLEEIIAKATHGIDLHTGGGHRANLPHIRANLDDPQVHALARAFDVPVLVNSSVRDGSLRQVAADLGVCTLLYEAGEALRFDELCVRAGVRGILNVMRALGMLRKARSARPGTEPMVARSTRWVRAPGAGITRFVTPLGARVKVGEVLGTISDPFGEREQNVHAPCDGIVLGRNNLPLVNEGDALFHIALFESSHSVAEQVEAFQNMLSDPELESVDNQPPIV